MSAMSLSHAQTLTFTDSSIGRFMLIQIVGGCLCVAVCDYVCTSAHRLCVFGMLIHNTTLPPRLNHSPCPLCHSRNSMA